MNESIAIKQYQEGRYGRARQLLEQLVEVLTEVECEDHPPTLDALSNLAIVLRYQVDFVKALAMICSMSERS